MDETITAEEVLELERLRDEIDSCLSEIEHILGSTHHWSRARGYWFAHIQGALHDNGWGGSMFTMEETINDIVEELSEEELEEYNEVRDVF